MNVLGHEIMANSATTRMQLNERSELETQRGLWTFKEPFPDNSDDVFEPG